jgi:hypothetical protein
MNFVPNSRTAADYSRTRYVISVMRNDHAILRREGEQYWLDRPSRHFPLSEPVASLVINSDGIVQRDHDLFEHKCWGVARG